MSNENQVLETILNALKKELETENIDEAEFTALMKETDAENMQFDAIDDGDEEEEEEDDDDDENAENNAQQLKIYDYNETIVIEDGAGDGGDGVSSVDDAAANNVNAASGNNKNDASNPPAKKSKSTITLLKETDKPVVGVYKCSDCPFKTDERRLMTRHLKTHAKERPYICSVCERAFKSNNGLQNHLNSHLGKKPYQCKSCEMRFNTPGELSRHVRYKHTHEKPHKCGECDYSSVELSKMRRHMRCHTGERPYQCPHCTYASTDTFKLKRHLRTHTGEKPYECDICLARFTQSNSLKSHKLIHSVGERPVFQCTLCPTTCGRKTDLHLHMRKLHTADKPIECKRCGKEMPDRYNYKMHVKTHEGEKCYRCTICPYASISQRHLDMHMLVHTDEKPFKCEKCNLAFRQRQLLIRHVNIYHNKDYVPPEPQAKKHNCPHCRRAFSRKGNLMRHMEVHDGRVQNDLRKHELKNGRKIKIHLEENFETKLEEDIDEHFNQIAVIDEAEHDCAEEEEEREDCKFIEIIDDMSSSNCLSIENESLNSSKKPNAQKSIKRMQSLVTSSIKLTPADITVQQSSSSSIKREQKNLPTKIEVDSKRFIISDDDVVTNYENDADDSNDDANHDFYVIEVIEDDDAIDENESVDNSILKGLSYDEETAGGKRAKANAFEFVVGKKLLLPMELNEGE